MTESDAGIPDIGVPDTGEAAAATKNRQIKVRLRIIEALQRLGIQYLKWPDFVRLFYANLQERIEYQQPKPPYPFQPPHFDRLKQSPDEWVKAADAAWQQHRNKFLQVVQSWVTAGVDEEIPPAKSTRGAGRKGRRLNAYPGLRIEWAARRLSGAAWKEIADESFNEGHVKKAATEVLKLAGWPTKVKPPNTPEVDPALLTPKTPAGGG